MLARTSLRCGRPAVSALPIKNARCFATYDEADTPWAAKQKRLGRPVSPHVMIYDFPVPAIASISHRISGVVLTVGLYDMALWSLLGGDPANVSLWLHDSILAVPAKFAVAGAVSYHALGGLRHLYWDAFPNELSPATQRVASYAIIGSSLFISSIAAMW